MHIFLTGAKRAGKSTLLNAVLEEYRGRQGGFRTVRFNTFLPGQNTVHLLPVWGSQDPTEDNLLFVCGNRNDTVMERFDRLGCQALADSKGAELLVMDELGPHETDAAAFQQAVWNAVNGSIPILGVLQEADAPFLEKIRRHPRVFLLRVTEENRDQLVSEIPQMINILTERVKLWPEKH